MRIYKIFFIILTLSILILSINLLTDNTNREVNISVHENHTVNFNKTIYMDGYFNYLVIVGKNKNSFNSNGFIIGDINFGKNNYSMVLSDNLKGKLQITYNKNAENKKLDYTSKHSISLSSDSTVNIDSDSDYDIYKFKDNGYLSLFVINNSIESKEYDNFIIYSRDLKDYSFLDRYVNNSYSKMFGVNPKRKLPVAIIDSDIDIIDRENSMDYSGYYMNGNTWVKNMGLQRKNEIISHELAHYYTDLSFKNYPETWLSEGIAEYMSRIYEDAYISKIDNLEECREKGCYRTYNQFNINYIKNISKDFNPEKKAWRNSTDGSYQYSFIILLKYMVKNGKDNLKDEIKKINKGKDPEKIFDTRPCVEDIKDCANKLLYNWSS